MAGSTWGKRQREKAKREKKAARRARRDMKREEPTEEPAEGLDEEALMARFAALNQALAEGRINQESFETQRDEIWEAMGLPPAT